MTSEEIKAKPAADLTTNGWLREVAWQLALFNEKGKSDKTEVLREHPVSAPKMGAK